MKMAVCFSGMLRTGIEAFPSIERFIGDFWGSCDFFMHTWDLDYHNVLTGETVEHMSENNDCSIDIQKLTTIKNLYKIKAVEVDKYHSKMDEIGNMFSNYVKNDQWMVPWFYSWQRSILLKRKYEINNNFKYDVVVKLRPDVIFDKRLHLSDFIYSLGDNDFGINMVYDDAGSMITDDIVFISKGDIADRVSDWWIHRLVSGDHNDNSIPTFAHFYNFIKQRGINPVDLKMYYMGDDYKLGLLRQECSIFDPITEFDKCVECDRLHYHVLTEDECKHVNKDDIARMKENTMNIRKTLPTGLK